MEPKRSLDVSEGFEEPGCVKAIRIGCVLGWVEGDADMTLGRQVVDLGRLDCPRQASRAAGIIQVSVVEVETKRAPDGRRHMIHLR